jgi:hypothetical protein
MKQRQLKLLGRIIIGALLFSGNPLIWSAEAFGNSNPPQKNARIIIIFVDMSGSANQARGTIYKEAFEKVYHHLQEGDRVVVGAITSRSYIDYKPAVDVEIPKKTVWDNRITYDRNLTQSREKLRREVNKLLARKEGSSLSEILDSLNIVDTIFHGEKERQKILVMLSDMMEDSREYNFERDKITDQYINNVITSRQNNNLMPNLTGVKVYVAGASADNSNRFRAVQTFWARYFAKSGANFSPHRYGHSLIYFENEP